MVKLTVLAGPDTDSVFTFSDDAIVIGRGDDCEMVLHDGTVSRRHCRIDKKEGIFTVSDLRTPNGTFLQAAFWPDGGRFRIDTRTLSHGDEISLGQSRLRVALSVAEEQSEEKHSSLCNTDFAPDSSLAPHAPHGSIQVADPPPVPNPAETALPDNWQVGMTVIAPRPSIPHPPPSHRTLTKQATQESSGLLTRLQRFFSGFIGLKTRA